jgi:hypothetical protein
MAQIMHIDFGFKTVDELMDMADEEIDRKALEDELELMGKLLYYEND